MNMTLHDIVDPWLLDEGSDDLVRLRDQLIWLRKHLFGVYEPSEFQSFDDRLTDWLLNVDDDRERRALFRLLGHLFFIAKPQFYALCRGTFNDAVMRWLIDEEEISLDDPDLSDRLTDAVRDTWFCPVTDSMNINAFLKKNQVQGNDVRGDFRSYVTIGDPDLLRKHIADGGIKRLVLVEDFVGSGEQMRTTVVWARKTLTDISILLAPLVCCPEGLEVGQILAKTQNLTFAPTLSLRPELFLLPEVTADEPAVFGEVRLLIDKVKHRLGRWQDEPFGHGQTGAIIATFSNCPDNTLPIIHEENPQWKALFPRIRRD